MDMMEQMLGDIAKQVSSGDMMDFSKMAARSQEALAPDKDYKRAQAEIIAKPFLTPEGQTCLKALLQHVVLQRLTLPVQAATMEQQAMHSAERQGQHAIIAFVFQQIAISNGAQPSKTSGG